MRRTLKLTAIITNALGLIGWLLLYFNGIGTDFMAGFFIGITSSILLGYLFDSVSK